MNFPFNTFSKQLFNGQSSSLKIFWFLFRVVIFYAVFDCFFLVYTGLTIPNGNLYVPILVEYFDFISVFREFLLWGGAKFASLIGYPSGYTDFTLYVRDGSAVRLVYSCMGFSLMSAYAALILAWPTKWINRIVSLLCGTVIIILLNMVRLGGLAVLYTTGHYGFFRHINHHDLFNIIMLIVTFLMFILHVKYSEKRRIHNETKVKVEKQ